MVWVFQAQVWRESPQYIIWWALKMNFWYCDCHRDHSLSDLGLYTAVNFDAPTVSSNVGSISCILACSPSHSSFSCKQKHTCTSHYLHSAMLLVHTSVFSFSLYLFSNVLQCCLYFDLFFKFCLKENYIIVDSKVHTILNCVATYQHWLPTCLQVGLHNDSKSGSELWVVHLTLQIPE